MVQKPANFDDINADGMTRRLPMGGYVAQIKKVTDDEAKQFLEIEYDIAEGEFKGIALENYEKWGSWSYKFRVYYTNKAMWMFKRFITRVEETNQGFAFDWSNPKCLVGKGLGIVVGMRQYYSSRDGSLKEAAEVQDYCTAKDVRDGNLPSEPKTREPKGEPPAPAMTTIEEDVSSDDLPF